MHYREYQLEIRQNMIDDFSAEIERAFYERQFVNQIIRSSCSARLEQYRATGDIEFVWNGIAYIMAYLQLGFDYKKNVDLFDQFFEAAGYRKKYVTREYYNRNRSLMKTRNSIREMIRNWRPSPQQPMKTDDLVNDILEKVSNRKIGFSQYKCMATDCAYELFINQEEMILHDCSTYHRSRLYAFFEEE